MSLRLQHIIDLEYLLDEDDAQTATVPVQMLQERDRCIYKEMDPPPEDRQALVMRWIEARKLQERESRRTSFLFPGELFDRTCSMATWLAGIAGLFVGFLVVTAFLVYHGTRPVNVTLFLFLFAMVPLLLTLVSAGAAWIWKGAGSRGSSGPGLFHTLIFSVMLKTCGRVIHRLEYEPVRKGRKAYDALRLILKKKAFELGPVLYGPFFILTCLFSICFSVGTLAGTFFRVVVSDLAFGWQSTLSTSPRTVFEIVSAMSWPWKYLVPQTIAHPDIEQIEGSRIILKEGISVLATQDLVSWWPFLCLSIACYAIVPRFVVMAAGIWHHRFRLAQFHFSGPQINNLIARMTSPVVGYDIVEAPVSQAVSGSAVPEGRTAAAESESPAPIPLRTLLLINCEIYTAPARAVIAQKIARHLLFPIKETVCVTHRFNTDETVLKAAAENGADQAVLIQEAWQPPIKGLLFYIGQVAAILPEKTCLHVVLTNDAGDPDPCIGPDDPDLDIWHKAIGQLNNPNIQMRGLCVK